MATLSPAPPLRKASEVSQWVSRTARYTREHVDVGDPIMSTASPSPTTPSRFAPGAEAVPALLIALAALGWWWTLRVARMGMSMAALPFLAFLVAWVAMMAAMMFPAVAPVVRLYARAAAKGHVAPLPVFVAGYLLVWSAIG